MVSALSLKVLNMLVSRSIIRNGFRWFKYFLLSTSFNEQGYLTTLPHSLTFPLSTNFRGWQTKIEVHLSHHSHILVFRKNTANKNEVSLVPRFPTQWQHLLCCTQEELSSTVPMCKCLQGLGILLDAEKSRWKSHRKKKTNLKLKVLTRYIPYDSNELKTYFSWTYP